MISISLIIGVPPPSSISRAECDRSITLRECLIRAERRMSFGSHHESASLVPSAECDFDHITREPRLCPASDVISITLRGCLLRASRWTCFLAQNECVFDHITLYGNPRAGLFWPPKRIWEPTNTQFARRSEPHPTDDLLRFDHITGCLIGTERCMCSRSHYGAAFNSYRAPNVISITYTSWGGSFVRARCDFDHRCLIRGERQM